MKAVQFDTVGEPAQVLTLRDIPQPTPQEGEILVRVKARSINPSDLAFIRGQYGIRPKPPCGAGFEAMGVVEALGAGVDSAKIPAGTRVSFTALTGTWQEYVCIPAATVIPLPDGISDEVGAQMFANPVSAWAMLHECNLKAGDWLLLTAGASTFSQLVLQLAVEQGIKVICTVRRDDFTEHLTKLGAAAVVNTAKESLQQRVKELTGRGANAALEAIGGTAGAEAVESLTRGGTMLVYGMLSSENIPLNSGILIFKQLTVRGFWLTEWMKTTDATTQYKAASTLIKLFASGKLNVTIDATYVLEDFMKAITHAEQQGRGGKVIIVG